MNAKTALLMVLLALSSLGFSYPYSPSSMITPLKSVGEGPLFYVDYSNLKGIDNKTFVEFYVQIGYDELQFIKYNGRFQASYDLDFVIYDTGDNVIENYTTIDVFEVETFSETRSRDKARISLVAFSFEPGQYRIKALVTDVETQKTSVIEDAFVARSFDSQNLMISDIQLSQKIEPAQEGQPYVKNQRYIEPNAVRIFAHGVSDIHIYFELYNLAYSPKSENSTYTAVFIFHDGKGNKIAQFKRRQVKPGKTVAHSLKVPVEYFTGGTYTLTVHVQDNGTGQTAESSKSFTVVGSSISFYEPNADQVLY